MKIKPRLAKLARTETIEVAALVALFAGVWLEYALGVALICVAVVVLVALAVRR